MYLRVAKTYYPLLLSKLFIVSEIFICAVAVARFDNPKINQAALSGLILPLGFLYESVIYDLVTASTALCKNIDCFKVLKRYFIYICGTLTAFGLVFFVSPAVDFLIFNIFNSSTEVAELAKPALPFLITWPWLVGYRRMLQGVMIRSGRSDLVGLFSCIRVAFLCLALYLVYLANAFSGAYSSTLALTLSVLVEAVLVHLAFEKMRKTGRIVDQESEILDLAKVNQFYLPLILSSLVHHSSLAIASWAMFNMTDSLMSLSVWGAISGIVWLLSTFGYAYVDVVVFYSQQDVDRNIISRFSYLIAAFTSLVVLSFLFIPQISDLIFLKVLKLNSQQIEVASIAMLIGILMPALRSIISVPQGQLIAAGKTSVITEGVILNVFALALFIFSAAYFKLPVLGIYCYLASLTVALAIQFKFFSERA